MGKYLHLSLSISLTLLSVVNTIPLTALANAMRYASASDTLSLYFNLTLAACLVNSPLAGTCFIFEFLIEAYLISATSSLRTSAVL